MISRRPQTLLVAALLLAGPGCVGLPEPVPIPAPDGQLLRASPVPVDGSEGPVHLIGLPAAVARAGVVSVERNGERFETHSTAAGSFSVELTAKIGDVLSVRLDDSEPTAYAVQAFTPIANPSPHALTGVPPLTGPVSGVVTIRGASPSAPVFAVNLATGDVAITPALDPNAATFSIEIAAESGHTLRVYIDATPLGPPWELTVP